VTTTAPQRPDQRPAAPLSGGPPRPRRWTVIAGALLALLAAGVVIALTSPFSAARSAPAGASDNTYPTSLATVRQGHLASQVNATGTLGYTAQADGSPYSVINPAAGIYTSLPIPGQVIHQGQIIYQVTDNPVVLLNGSTPMYRSLSQGDSGPDVQQLNADLVALGYATSSELDPASDYFSSETAYALEQLQGKLGEDETGSLDLGQAVFLPGPLRISQVTATLGTAARPGGPVAQATSTSRQVQVQLDASQQSNVKLGDKALITLPDNQTTAGTVTRIGTIASSSGSSSAGGSGSGSSTATIPLYVTLKDPKAAGTLDQSPVQVQITTAGVNHALIVPINSLVAESGGGYAVETADARGVHHLVPVALGLFDDADGLVQVTSAGLTAGDQVVVPST
jgi:hypothetical protein